jgi:hypothetical protein
MTPKFDQLSEGFLKGLGSTISSAANMAQKAYNFPGKAIGALNQVVQQGDISPITGAAAAVGSKMQGKNISPLKAGDKVRFINQTLFKDTPNGVESKLDQPKKFQGGNLYSAKIVNHPRVGSVQIYDNPNDSTQQNNSSRKIYYFDKNGQPINDVPYLSNIAYIGPNPDKSKKEHIVAGDEAQLIPGSNKKNNK